MNTTPVFVYPKGSVGRRMTTAYVAVQAAATVSEASKEVRSSLDDVESIYVVPVIDDDRQVLGTLTLRDLMRAADEAFITDIMQSAEVVSADDDAESAARACTRARSLGIPVVDREHRLIGLLTIEEAVSVLEREDTEDAARQGGVEPLGLPYLSTPIRSLVRSRIVWLLVLAIGATLTVQVLSVFEDTLEQVTVLALFVPLLIGTGGNTGNQAATTVTRALALGDVRPNDLVLVFLRELGVGLFLGALLGVGGGLLTGLIFEPQIGLVIGLTLVAICAMAAAIGGIMPIIARTLRVDPAVFSNPFITTFVDASGLIVYFLIAQWILQIAA